MTLMRTFKPSHRCFEDSETALDFIHEEMQGIMQEFPPQSGAPPQAINDFIDPQVVSTAQDPQKEHDRTDSAVVEVLPLNELASTELEGNDGPIEDRKTTVSICPETLFAMSVWIFVMGAVISAIITFGFTKPDLSKDPILAVYGTVNVCIAFYYQPARSVFGVLRMAFSICQAAYAALFYYRVTVYYPEGSWIRTYSKIYCPMYTLMTSSMILSLIIPPDESIVGHPVPFQVRRH